MALVLLGLGWSFLFVGGTTLLTDNYSGPEKAKAQGLNDFLVFGMVALTALSSGALHHADGWVLLNMAMIPFIAAALACGLWLQRRAINHNRLGCRLDQRATRRRVMDSTTRRLEARFKGSSANLVVFLEHLPVRS